MENLFKKIKQNKKHIEAIEDQMKCVRTMPYYSIFSTPSERNRDLNTCREAMDATLIERRVYLTKLQEAIKKELGVVSMEKYKNNLILNQQ